MESAYRAHVHDSTYEQAGEHLRRAVQLDSSYAAPRIALARMYVGVTRDSAATAVRLLSGIHVKPGDPDAVEVHEGLAFALYYDSRVAEASSEARLAMAAGSKNDMMQTIVDRATRK
jgi:hypothetical protein